MHCIVSPQLLHYLRNVHFQAPSGEKASFNANGDFSERYDILNRQETPKGNFYSVKIGYIYPMVQRTDDQQKHHHLEGTSITGK